MLCVGFPLLLFRFVIYNSVLLWFKCYVAHRTFLFCVLCVWCLIFILGVFFLINVTLSCSFKFCDFVVMF